MKITYCGIEETKVKPIANGNAVVVNFWEEIEVEERQAQKLLQAYSNMFALSFDKDEVKRLKELNEKKEAEKQKAIDEHIKTMLIKEEEAKKEEVARAEREAKQKEEADKAEVAKRKSERENAMKALEEADRRFKETKEKAEADKKERDARIEKIKKELFSK